jgi:preprotein translocase subunit SecE
MADDKKVAVKADEKAPGKVVSFFKNLPKKIAQPFKNMWHELRKVTWPTKTEWLNCTLIVLAFMVFMGIIIGLLDLGSSSLIQLIIKG